MKLIPMTDFVLEQGMNPLQTDVQAWIESHRYAEFLKQPLTLGMFIPCDENGNVLEEPKNYKEWLRKSINIAYDIDLIKYDQYQQAKERVLFVYKPHFDLSVIKHQISQGKNIEYLVNHGSIELTESSKKLIYGL